MTPDQWTEIVFFHPDEFDSPDLAGSGIHMDHAFVKLLDKLRIACGFPLVVHSGYRTLLHNAQLEGSVTGSEHTVGKGADIGCSTSRQRFIMIHEAMVLGFTRIGIGKTFVHLGVEETKPQNVIWLY